MILIRRDYLSLEHPIILDYVFIFFIAYKIYIVHIL